MTWWVRAVRPLVRAVEVQGVSMVPAYVPGEIVLVARRLGPLRCGDVVVTRDHGAGEWLKRVHAITPEGVDIRGDNADASIDSRQRGLWRPRDLRWRVRRADLR
jgi:phage repressor protein C with HTH and peptisase S24 domain